MGKTRILASAWHNGSINAILPVLRQLKEDKDHNLTILAHGPAIKTLNSTDLPFKTLQNYGINEIYSNALRAIIKRESPDLVLTGVSVQGPEDGFGGSKRNGIEKLITSEAKKINIPTIAVLDSWNKYAQRFNNIHTGEPLEFLPDKLAVMDEYAKKDLIDLSNIFLGYSPEKIVVTGNPHFDNLSTLAQKFTDIQKQEIRKNLGLESEVIIFYAGKQRKKGLGFWDLDNIQVIGEAIKNIPKNKVGLVANFHPRTSEEDFKEIADYMKKYENMKIENNTSTKDLILASDLTTVSISTVAMEAIYMGKPCISLQPGLIGEDQYLSVLTKNNIIPFATNQEDARELVKKAATDREYRKNLIENASDFKTDGKATERVMHLISAIAG